MASVFPWTCSRTAVSVWRVTVVPCVTSRGSCLTPAAATTVNTGAARSLIQERPTATVRPDTPESSVMQVGDTHITTVDTPESSVMQIGDTHTLLL